MEEGVTAGRSQSKEGPQQPSHAGRLGNMEDAQQMCFDGTPPQQQELLGIIKEEARLWSLAGAKKLGALMNE